jgi:oligoribonuclease NrnB/cAMP/cGMP phosphodiesterase (DHH superfamily)
MKGSSLVIYHYPCVDGGFAAYAAAMTLNAELTKFIPYNPRSPPLVGELPEAETVYFLDCAGPSAQYLQDCCRRFTKVVVLDHHKTGLEIMAGISPTEFPNFGCRYEAKHSGCTMALEHFHPDLSEKMRLFFLYVEDNDTWTHALYKSKEFTAGLSSLNIDFRWDVDPEGTATLMESLTWKSLVEVGETELKRRAALIEEYAKKSVLITLGGVDGIRAVEISPDDHGITSQLGHELALMSTEGLAAIFVEGRVSLRAMEGVDSTRIAKQYGGGGHAGASGFGMTRENWLAVLEKK